MKRMKKSIVIFGAGAIALLMVFSATAVTVMQTNETKNVLEGEQDEQNVLLMQGYKEKLQSAYGIDIDISTMGEFEQLLYSLISDVSFGDPLLDAQLTSDLNEFFDILDQIGVTPDMTIAEAIVIIIINRQTFLALRFNILCRIDLDGAGTTFPYFFPRYIKLAYGVWETGLSHPSPNIEINGILGHQSGAVYGERHKGFIIGLLGQISTTSHTGTWGLPYTKAHVHGFALWSRSNVPFTGGSSSQPGSQQSSQQSTTTLTTGQSSPSGQTQGQNTYQGSQQSTTPLFFQILQRLMNIR